MTAGFKPSESIAFLSKFGTSAFSADNVYPVQIPSFFQVERDQLCLRMLNDTACNWHPLFVEMSSCTHADLTSDSGPWESRGDGRGPPLLCPLASTSLIKF